MASALQTQQQESTKAEFQNEEENFIERYNRHSRVEENRLEDLMFSFAGENATTSSSDNNNDPICISQCRMYKVDE